MTPKERFILFVNMFLELEGWPPDIRRAAIGDAMMRTDPLGTQWYEPMESAQIYVKWLVNGGTRPEWVVY